MSTDKTEKHDEPRPLLDHINELSKRAKVWIYAFAASTFFFLAFPTDFSLPQNFLVSYSYKPLIALILVDIRKYLLPKDYTLIGGTVTAPLELLLVGAVVFGFAASAPVFAYEIYKFVDPAIKPSEKQSIGPFVTGFSVLYLVGALFAFFVLLPVIFFFSLPFFQATQIPATIFADQFYYLVFFTVMVTGFAFTIPVIFVLLVKLHVLGTATLRQNRKYVWGVVLVLTAVLSPDGGPLADIALFLPVIVLLEAALRVARRYEKDLPPLLEQPTAEPVKCAYCGGPMDKGGVFCGLCGKSRK